MDWYNGQTFLNKVNYGLFGLHLLAGLTLLIFSFFYRDRNFDFELYAGGDTYSIGSKWLVWMAVAFLAITSAFHLWYAIDWKNMYSRSAHAGKQSTRWLEYGITATIMAVIVAIISGIKDVYTLAVLAALTVGIMSTGLWFENIFGVESKLMMAIPLIIGFGLLFVYATIVFFGWRDEKTRIETEESEKLPSWITWVVLGTLAFFGSFGIVPVIRYFKSSLNPIWFEYIYLALSAISKLYLGFFLGYGLLQRLE